MENHFRYRLQISFPCKHKVYPKKNLCYQLEIVREGLFNRKLWETIVISDLGIFLLSTENCKLFFFIVLCVY